MFAKASILAIFTASASAAAVPDHYIWHLNGVTSVCTAATCRYGFNVTGAAGPLSQPSFYASGCIGTSVQGGYKSCSVVGMDVPGDVLTQEFNKGIDVGASISVRYTFDQEGVRYTYTGNTTIAHGGAPADVDINPSELVAVPIQK